ncbi:GDSL esterase/lipase At5g45910 [Medicago truncatula]|uniref:GDSL-like lipase/acylhydrolase n=1 Tax=Medicago truncatula TaxID=3880 RepID=G7JAK8_MEDTR|nr:GDSL esterase/lipase At5g45910 [Medicago truncatula]AES71072.2 GDSL-like lipase/acylhydrolase [Medicago truncatula]
MKISILFGITFACGFFGNFISNANPLPYEAIFNFGDSTSDTGNAAFDHLNVMEKLIPYGSTYFKHPSGRQSNGRLIIDFIAEAYGLPFLPAYKNITKIPDDIKKGVNFAYAGSTALDVKYFSGISGVSAPKESLNVQFDWFKKLKPDLCKSKEECDSFFKNSLFIVGEIGGNDIFYHLSKTITELREKVPLMVESIKNTTNALIEEGAVELVVPGNFPMGCNTDILSKKISQKKEDYDEFGCLIAYNTLIEYFNEQLKKSIETIKQKHPQAKIVYFDYYNDAKRLYQTPQQYGFISDKVEILKACCGGSGPYHHDEYWCGTPNTTVCSDPSKLINWDGPHFTEAAYKQIAKGLIEGPFAYPSLKPAPFKIA